MKSKTGVAFGDYITTGRGRKISSYDRPSTRGMRSSFVLIILAVSTLAIVLKLLTLQIFQGNYYRSLSDENRVKTLHVHAPRGTIFDRNKIPLVFNIPGYRQVIDKKTRILDQEEAIKLLSKGEELEIDSLREYPKKEAFAHVLGYLGQISEEKLKNPSMSSYLPGDLIGQSGLEEYYENILKGKPGKTLYEVDTSGKTIRKLGTEDPISGRDIFTTLDATLQEKSYNAFKDTKRGAIIVSTPKGEILTLISKPSFDPNLFTLSKNYKTATDSAYQKIENILTDSKDVPLLNRTISGVYPPGSTFKIVTAATGLRDGTINSSYSVEDTGVLRVGEFSFANWYFTDYGRTEGSVDVVKGLKRSNDIFFYRLAEKVGVTRLSQTAREFGAGSKLNIDLSGEEEGLVPTPSWKEKVIGEKWYLGDTFHYGIGQGYLLSTPLQVNAWAQIIANKGILYRPHIIKSNNTVIKEDFLDDASIDLIRKGMIESCQEGGVAWSFFNLTVKNEKLKIDGRNILEVKESSTSGAIKNMRKISVACKTGTAQHGGEKTLPHSWITLFAPAYDPEIVVTVLAEEAGEGSNVAGPIAKHTTTFKTTKSDLKINRYVSATKKVRKERK